ncbi:MAG: DUF5069 domain-containing protein [Nitrospirae bacterium]|nr:DUF5069 domain-containing protein [Nitrospirota bacterium]
MDKKLARLAPDLTKGYPRSPRDTLGGFVIAARSVDKCRAELAGTQGEYTYQPCGLTSMFLDFAGISAGALRDFVATGADDQAVAAWIGEHAKVRDRLEIIRWNNRMRELRLSDLPDDIQAMMEDYIPQNLPKHRPVYVFFDVYDLEEGRL